MRFGLNVRADAKVPGSKRATGWVIMASGVGMEPPLVSGRMS